MWLSLLLIIPVINYIHTISLQHHLTQLKTLMSFIFIFDLNIIYYYLYNIHVPAQCPDSSLINKLFLFLTLISTILYSKHESFSKFLSLYLCFYLQISHIIREIRQFQQAPYRIEHQPKVLYVVRIGSLY